MLGTWVCPLARSFSWEIQRSGDGSDVVVPGCWRCSNLHPWQLVTQVKEEAGCQCPHSLRSCRWGLEAEGGDSEIPSLGAVCFLSATWQREPSWHNHLCLTLLSWPRFFFSRSSLLLSEQFYQFSWFIVKIKPVYKIKMHTKIFEDQLKKSQDEIFTYCLPDLLVFVSGSWI